MYAPGSLYPPPLSLATLNLKTIGLFLREIDWWREHGSKIYWINLRVFKRFYIFLGPNVNEMKRFILY